MISENVITAGTDGPSLRAALASGAQSLGRAGVDTSYLDAEVLLGHVLAMTREELLSSANIALTSAQIRRFEEALRRRLEREPVAYITRNREFWSQDFYVTPDVLIPRPDTERLVEIALALAAAFHATRPLRILDVGTGSGAVAVSLAKELPSAELWATDVSTAALAIAQGNAAGSGTGERIRFFGGDLFDALDDKAVRFDLIVSNPPYIRSGDIAGLAPEVNRWEPRSALDGGVDGLDFYRRITTEAWPYLASNGAVALEIGAGIGAAVVAVFAGSGRYAPAQVFFDYAGRDRVVVARRSQKGAGGGNGGR
jgi:release factor glutamine methyltransferase